MEKITTYNQFKQLAERVNNRFDVIESKLNTLATNEEIEDIFDDVFKKLTSIEVTLSGTDTININNGEPSTNEYTATVKAIYDNGAQEILSDGYSLEWNSYNENNGIIFENGILTIGNMTVVGNYTIPITVKAIKDRYSDIATFNVTVNIIAPNSANANYTIRMNNTNETINFGTLMSKIKDGTVINDYGWDNQIIIPYTDPFDGKEYECPFAFGTYQEFEKEDGTKFMGLGLLAHYCLPTSPVMFDAKEPDNPLHIYVRDNGSNRWKESNLRQWMNKTGLNWYEPQHEYDTPPTKPDPATVTGLLDCFPSDFIDMCIPVKMRSITHTLYGGGYDTTYDKLFLLSLSQCNCKSTDPKFGLNDESEGRYWEYWRNRHGGNTYWTGTSQGTDEFTSDSRRSVYKIENPEKGYTFWLRSTYRSNPHTIWNISNSGYVNFSSGYYAERIAPACVIG